MQSFTSKTAIVLGGTSGMGGQVDGSTQTFTKEYSQSIASVSGAKNEELDSLMEGHYRYYFTNQEYADTHVGEKLNESLLLDPQIKQLFHLN